MPHIHLRRISGGPVILVFSNICPHQQDHARITDILHAVLM
jgi:hypothetical protein